MPRELKKSIWPYMVDMPSAHSDISLARLKWLEENLPKGSYYVIIVFNAAYYFKREEDLSFFLLRWSGTSNV